jgi:purine-binding chemotaxis protein CheW
MEEEASSATTVKTRQMVVFKISDETFATPISAIREVIKLDHVTPVPGSSPSVAGIVNIRGKIVPLIELGILLQIGKHTSEKAYTLLINTKDNGLVGMIVDEVSEIHNFSEEEIKAAPNVIATRVSADFISGVILPVNTEASESVILLIDIEASITHSMSEIIAQIAEKQINSLTKPEET